MNIRKLAGKIFGNQRKTNLKDKLFSDEARFSVLNLTRTAAKKSVESDPKRRQAEKTLRDLLSLLFGEPLHMRTIADMFINGNVTGGMFHLVVGAALDDTTDFLCSALTKHEAAFRETIREMKNPFKVLNFQRAALKAVDHETLHDICGTILEEIFKAGQKLGMTEDDTLQKVMNLEAHKLKGFADKVEACVCSVTLREQGILPGMMDAMMELAHALEGTDSLVFGKLPEQVSALAYDWVASKDDRTSSFAKSMQGLSLSLLQETKNKLPPNAYFMECFGILLLKLNSGPCPNDIEYLTELMDKTDSALAEVLDKDK